MIAKHRQLFLDNRCIIEKLAFKAPFRLNAHLEKEGCFVYFKKGTPSIYATLERLSVSSDQSVLLKCGQYIAEFQRLELRRDCEVVVIHLPEDVIRRLYKNSLPRFVKPKIRNSIRPVVTSEMIRKFIDSLDFYFENPSLADDELVELKIRELILLLSKSNEGESVVSLISFLFSPREFALKEVINNHLYSRLNVDELATLVNMSSSTFHREFTAMFRDTPANYLKSKRLERARELLTASSMTLSEIAFETGFSDLSHFSRLYKAKYEEAPSRHRVESSDIN